MVGGWERKKGIPPSVESYPLKGVGFPSSPPISICPLATDMITFEKKSVIVTCRIPLLSAALITWFIAKYVL